MTNDIFLDHPPPSDQRIEALHAWIATYADGSEGIIAGSVNGTMLMMVSSNRVVALALEGMAAKAMRLSAKSSKPVSSVRLVSFASTEARS